MMGVNIIVDVKLQNSHYKRTQLWFKYDLNWFRLWFYHTGPLFKNTNGRFSLIGINSGGIPCESDHHPKIFTRVSDHTNWIIENINNEMIHDVDGMCLLLYFWDILMFKS